MNIINDVEDKKDLFKVSFFLKTARYSYKTASNNNIIVNSEKITPSVSKVSPSSNERNINICPSAFIT